MTTLRASSILSSPSSSCKTKPIRATLHNPQLMKSLHVSFPKLQTRSSITSHGYPTQPDIMSTITSEREREREDGGASNSLMVTKLYAILEAVSDRIEMHANIGEQRNNWNNLLLNSLNGLTLTAATMAGLASIAGEGVPLLALKLSSALLYSAATGMSLVMNKIQPSQLAEEQRNTVRLFKQLHGEIQTVLALGVPSQVDVNNAMEKVLALDKACPLPLLGGVMLDKFPKTVKPAVWWPHVQQQIQRHPTKGKNGWDPKLEEQMRVILGVLEKKDTKEYVKLAQMILRINKVLAIAGPLLTAVAALGSTLVGSPSYGSWAAVFAVVGGAMAGAVNALEHGGQVGMVFEMYRSCAGSFQLLQESIQSALAEKEVDMRVNGEVLEMKVALELGRSLSELRTLAATQEFASKLL